MNDPNPSPFNVLDEIRAVTAEAARLWREGGTKEEHAAYVTRKGRVLDELAAISRTPAQTPRKEGQLMNTNTTTCPEWCDRHRLGDGGRVVAHEATITQGTGHDQVSLGLALDVPGAGGPTEPYVSAGAYEWLSGQAIRNYAALLVRAADILDRG